MTARSGIGYDSHRLVADRPLILAGVELEGADRGLAGHSDADVATHAVIDALLGAAGLDDIGHHFPDDHPEYRDADSFELLRRVRALVERRGWTISWVDLTVICERPKLSPHREQMRERLAEGLGGGRVNVKFTTNEGMGAIGRGEGIAAIAVATVEPA
jgi:2-C-methyl-D-erythritol 2,4-cyclodiphosphate synthase